jgi:DNA-binding NarL/FixJ family response regulator
MNQDRARDRDEDRVCLEVSMRQGQILTLIEGGLSDKEIARRLGLSMSTVKTQLNRLYRRNGFKNRAQAAAAHSLWRAT